MRVMLMIATVVLNCGIALAAENPCSGSGAILDEKNGFRDAKLGTLFSNFSHMQPTEQEQYRTKTVKAYERDGDNLEVFGQSVSHIIYYFFKNQLFLVRLEWSDAAAGSAILNGFGEALACQPTTLVSGPVTTTFLRVSGKSVLLRAQHSNVLNASVGWLHIERVGAEETIQAQIQREAAAQF